MSAAVDGLLLMVIASASTAEHSIMRTEPFGRPVEAELRGNGAPCETRSAQQPEGGAVGAVGATVEGAYPL